AGCCTRRFPHRHAATDRKFDAGANLRQPGGSTPASAWQHRQLTLEGHEHAIWSFRKDIGGLRVSPSLVVRQTLGERTRPVLHRVVRTRRVVTAFESRDRRESFSWCLLLLTLDHADSVAHQNAGGEGKAYRRSNDRSFCHGGPSPTGATIRWRRVRVNQAAPPGAAGGASRKCLLVIRCLFPGALTGGNSPRAEAVRQRA